MGARTRARAGAGSPSRPPASRSTRGSSRGSFTRLPSDFLREAPELELGIALKGNGNALSATPTDSEFKPAAGIDALLAAAGLSGAGWAGGNGWIYTPAPVTYCTIKLFVSGLQWTFLDCIVSEATLSWEANGIGTLDATFAIGSVYSHGAQAFPASPNYGNQATLSPPVVRGVGHAWGPVRGFSELEISISNETEDVPDSNASTGVVPAQTARTIEVSGVVYVDDSQLDFEHGELVRTTAPTDPLTFTVGTTAATQGDTINAYRVTVTTPEATEMQLRKLGSSLAWELSLRAVSTAANGEFELLFL